MENKSINTETNNDTICGSCNDVHVKPHEGYFCTHCGVKFCKCIQPWIHKKTTCPTCNTHNTIVKMRGRISRISKVQFNKLKVMELFIYINKVHNAKFTCSKIKMSTYAKFEIISSRIEAWTTGDNDMWTNWLFQHLLEPVKFEACNMEHHTECNGEEPDDTDKILVAHPLEEFSMDDMTGLMSIIKEFRLMDHPIDE